MAFGMKTLSPQVWDSIYRAAGGFRRRDQYQRSPGEKIHKLAGILPLRNVIERYYALLSHWQKPEEIVIGAQEPPVYVTQPSLHPEIRDFPHKMMFLDLMAYLPGDILTKVDRASMAVSLELRVPYLDHRIVEFAWRLPLNMKIRDGIGKLPLRRLLHRRVPRALVDRPKAGFGVPIVDWLRGPLREWAEDLLSEERLKRDGFLEPKPIRVKWRQHLSGRRNWQYHLWDVLMFQAWLETKGSNSAAAESC
jgi:asparagine synthase (glutamine-hydrolysing)